MSWIDVKNNVKDLPPAQKQIAEYMLEHKSESIFMTARQLGENAGSSEASAIRLASTLGHANFPDFIKSLQNEAKGQLSTIGRFQTHKLQTQTGGLVAHIINMELEQARESVPSANDNAIKELAAMICAAPAVYIIGLRSAKSLAVYMEFYLSWFFPKIFMPSSDTLNNYLVAAPKNSLVIGISYPRYTKQTIECIALAKKRNFRTAAITDSLSSPLAQEADISVVSPCAHIAHIDSLLIPLGLINALLVEVADHLGAKALARLEELENDWDSGDVYC